MLLPLITFVAVAIGMTSAAPAFTNEVRAAGVPELPEGLFTGKCEYSRNLSSTLFSWPRTRSGLVL